jgi:hypothetical protein
MVFLNTALIKILIEMSTQQKPDLFISIFDIPPFQYIERDLAKIQANKLQIQFEKCGPRAFASMEWYIPAAITAYIFKSYFDVFLQEMAKDHYSVFKNWFTKQIGTARSIEIKTYASEQSPHKLSKGQSQSNAISLESDTRTGHRVKFLFDKSLSEEVWQKCMYEAFDIIEEHFADGENDTLTKAIKNKNLRPYVFGLINPETLEWEFVNSGNEFI